MDLTWAWNHPERKDGDAHMWFCLYTVIGVTGLFANLLVLIVFIHIKLNSNDRKNVTTTLIIHQSIIDMTSSVVFLPFYVIPEGWLIQDDRAGSIFCKCRSIFWILAGSSTVNLVFIAIERYIAIVHPIKYHVNVKDRNVYVVLPLAYVYGIVNMGHLAFVADLNKHFYCEYYWNDTAHPHLQTIIGIQNFVTFMLIPTISIVFAYGCIIYKLYRLKKRRPSYFNNRRYASQRNLIVTFIIVSIAYVVCWAPDMTVYLVYNVSGGTKPKDMGSGNLHAITVFLSASNMAINPFVYAWKYRQFRTGLANIFRKRNLEETQM